ncbi:MAG: hypothetical protein HRT88_17715 [Lentisphaeraceae bacterium]|nr:hypothetical protein [Lentisphaeraceae bacterium]
MKCIKSLLALSLMIFFTACSGLKNNKDNVDTIIIASTDYESRALAEHLQHRNNQLLMILPNNGDSRVYVGGPDQQIMHIDDSRFSQFIDFVNPKNIIVLGNEVYVPKSYLANLHESVNTIILDDKDWRLIAWQLEDLTGFGGLADDYISTLDRLIRAGNIKDYFAPALPEEPQAVIPVQ